MTRRTAWIAALVFAAGLHRATAARVVEVKTGPDLAQAIAGASPGDDIVLADGNYVIAGKLTAWADGSVAEPITVRAAHPLAARIGVADVIGFEVIGANWHFDALFMDGRCRRDTDCEHAFHVVGHADGFHLTNSRLANFNAHLKVNADRYHDLPAHGLVEGNEFLDSHPRFTNNPVAPINIDNATDWVVRGNLIHDFQKDGSGEDAYGAFVKGGSSNVIIERNLVECASGAPMLGRMVGLSLGAHGMGPALCPPHWDSDIPCDPEVRGGIIRNNIIGNCNGEGIYLNKGQDSRVLFNTLIKTGGIVFRYPSSTGIAQGNLMTGAITAQDGGQVTDRGNITGLADEPAVLRAQAQPAPAWKDAVPVTDDYCGRPRGGQPQYGALQAALGTCPILHWGKPPAEVK